MTSIITDKPYDKTKVEFCDSKKRNSTSNIDYSKIHMLPTGKLIINQSHLRKHFDDNSIICLADSIRRYGILQPITVRVCESNSNMYEIVAGERRYRAAKLLGLSNIPCIVVKADHLRSSCLSLIDNLHYECPNIFDQASAILSLMDTYGFSQEETASMLSVSKSLIANKLLLLKFTLPEREKILLHGLSERHARALLRISSPQQRLRVIEYISMHNLNVASTEAYISRFLSDSALSGRRQPNKIVLKDLRVFYNSINRAVNILKQGGINVEYRTTDTEAVTELTLSIPKLLGVSRETLPLDNDTSI